MVLGLEAVFAVGLGVLLFSERISALKCFGVLAVVLGIALLHLAEKKAPEEPTPLAALPAEGSAN